GGQSDSRGVKLRQLASPDHVGLTAGHGCGWSSPPSDTAVSYALRRQFGLDPWFQETSSVSAETEIPSSTSSEWNAVGRGPSPAPGVPVVAGPICHSDWLEDIPQVADSHSGLI